jgi:hypothetical protein
MLPLQSKIVKGYKRNFLQAAYKESYGKKLKKERRTEGKK